MRRSVFLKIFSGYLVVACLMAVMLFFVSYRIMRHYHIEALTTDLQHLGGALVYQIAPQVQSRHLNELDTFVKQLGSQINTRITVIDRSGVVLADSEKNPAAMDNHKTRTEVTQALYGATGSSVRYSTTVKESMLYVALPMERDGTVYAILRLSLFLSDINNMLSDLRTTILQLALAVIALALVASLVLARRLSRPVQMLGVASRRIAAGDFSARVFLKNQDEFHDLAESFNFMGEKVRTLFDELSLQKEQLDNIIASMHEGLLVIDQEDRVVLVNERMRAIAGTAFQTGAHYWEMLRDPAIGTIVEQVRTGQHNRIEELPLGGKTFVCSATCLPAHREIVLVLLDVSDIKNVERMKKDFVVNVSHELRTPLTAIKGFIDTMIEDVQDTSHKRYLDIIKRHTDRLINIVKDLMLLSNLEKVQSLELEDVYLKGLVEQTRKIYDQRLREKNLELRVETDSERIAVRADPFKLEQMFINLIDNAIKYTEQGEILVDIRHDRDQAVVTIQDTGIGMTSDHLTKIFERFYVVDKSRSRRVGGTGLGLSIVKHIVLLHNGSIDVASTPGAGTTFTITLPLAFRSGTPS